MGIPGLTARLSDYAEPVEWRHQDNRQPKSVIIDGPSLAYHVYHQVTVVRAVSEGVLPSYTGYSVIGDAVVALLDQLVEAGVSIKRVFFDGYLPDTKSSTRFDRVKRYLTDLRAFHADTTRPRGNGKPQYESTQSLPFGLPLEISVLKRTLCSRLTSPFLVPVAIEALLQSKYAPLTAVIPGEADWFCADAALANSQAFILSSDSDLFVTCAHVRVIMFASLTPQDDGSLRAQCYRPARIAASLGSKDFVSLAYLMAKDSRLTAKASARLIMQESSTPSLTQGDVDTWLRSIQSAPSSPLLPTVVPEALGVSLSRLDPRVSELIHRWAEYSHSHSTDNAGLCMHLPFLIDDPSRASAWRIGLNVRQIAYSTLHCLASLNSMQELDRRGERMVASTATLMPVLELQDACSKLHASLEGSLNTSYQKLNSKEMARSWRSVAATQVLARLSVDDTLPSREVVVEATSLSRITSLPALHLRAQMEAWIYSLRVVGQVLGFCKLMRSHMHLIHSKPEAQAEVWQAVEDFGETLCAMPSLQDLTTAPDLGFDVAQGAIFKDFLKAHWTDTAASSDRKATDPVASTRQGQKRKARRENAALKGKRVQTVVTPPRARSNAFELLIDESHMER